MDTVLPYIVKMITCSAVLFGYYRLALYNNQFHQWNRFYLLASLVLSLVLPLVNVQWLVARPQQQIPNLVQHLPWNNLPATVNHPPVWNVWLVLGLVVSVLMFVRLLHSIYKLVQLYNKSNKMQLTANIYLVLTHEQNAPFSFFSWLFWRSDIDPDSTNGNTILQHELTHIREKHSWDTLLVNLVLAVFWMNPFFWLIRREVATIHEFLADRRAVQQHNGAAFASMILQALPLQPKPHPLVQPFFTSNIKRRLFMITSSKLPRYSYLRRICGLIIMVFTAGAISLSVQQAQAQATRTIEKTKQVNDTTKNKPSRHIIIQRKEGGAAGEKEIIIEKKITTKNTEGQEALEKPGKAEAEIFNPAPGQEPLYILNGKEVTAAEVKALDQHKIVTIDVLKGDKAIAEHGSSAKNGVIKITTGTPTAGQHNQKNIVLRGDGTLGAGAAYPLVYADGKLITMEEMKSIEPNNIESINVLKGENAIKIYGQAAKDGVIEITMKKPVN